MRKQQSRRGRGSGYRVSSIWGASPQLTRTLAFRGRERRYIVGPPRGVPVLMGTFLALVILDTFRWPFRR
jgi:hypothetical protein